MIPTQTKLGMLFQVQRRFAVPLYQRQYVWKEENHDRLWEMITEKAELRAAGRQPKPRSLGTVVLSPYSFGSSIRTDLIVDGQQRLTTLVTGNRRAREASSRGMPNLPLVRHPRSRCSLPRLITKNRPSEKGASAMGLLDKLFGGNKFDAALNLVMTDYTYDNLPQAKRDAVFERAKIQMAKAGHAGEEVLVLAAMPYTLKLAFYMLAMKELGIQPAIPGESWRSANPFSSGAKDVDAQERAYEYIRQTHGIDAR